MKKNLNQDRKQLLEAIPERLIEWEKGGTHKLAVLLVPRFRKGLLKKWFQPRLKRPYMKVKLDEIGSFVWENCDGKKTVKDICNAMEDHFGERVKPVEKRVSLFFSTLYRSRFIRYWTIEKSDKISSSAV